MAEIEFGKSSSQPHHQPRPTSTASSQLSFSDRMDGDDGGDADEDNSSLRSNPLNYNNPSSTCSSSLNLQRQGSNASQGKDVATMGGGGAGGVLLNGAPLMARTTTISTIAMESNTSATSKCSPTRLVIALLQTPHQALHLKIIELSPNLLKLPDNLPEAEDYLKNHSQVIKNLQSKQSPVEELLRQADSLIATQKPRAEVYAAMADSLGQTWKDLNAVLDERRIVIDLAYNCHKVIQSCVDRMNALHSEYSKFNYIPSIEEQFFQSTTPQDVVSSLRKLKEDRADVLKGVSQALDVCQQLLNKITDFNLSIDSRQLFLKRDVDFATKQIHRWLERLHDRRMILEEKLKLKREQFEEMADFLVHDKDMASLSEDLERLRRASQEFSLGDSVPSAEHQRDELETMVRDMKMLQERALLTARKLEQDHQKGRFYQRSGLKQKIYEILGTVNDLITESIDFELSLVDAKEFFHLADMANGKLDELASSGDTTRSLPKSQINSLTYDALSKGQILLDSLGWDSPRTRGVRAVYDELNKRKGVIQDEIDHLLLLDEYNHFLESVNQAYQNILSVESSLLRSPKAIPVQSQSVREFQGEHERTMGALSDKSGFRELLSKLEEIYPSLSEEEKMSTEEKVNQLKCLSNLVVETLLHRIWLLGEWLKILELDDTEWPNLAPSSSSSLQLHQDSSQPDRARVADVVDNIIRLYEPIQEQLGEVHRSDPDLITTKMEEKIEEIIRKYRNRQAELVAGDKILDICHAYKVKLDHHLLGKPGREEESGLLAGISSTSSSPSASEPCYFPVLNDSLVATTLRSEEPTSKALEVIIAQQLQRKLNETLTNFFQPLLTDFRQEILEAQENLASPLATKTPEEVSWERYFERLKESYVKVTRELEGYLSQLSQQCRQVEDQLDRATISTTGSTVSVEEIEKELTSLTEFRLNFERNMDQELKRRLEHVLAVIGHEEPPIEATQEERTLRTLSSNIIHDRLDASISQKQDTITRQLTEKMIHNDLDMINRTLNELISELEHPCNYGNNLRDAETYLASFERFEKTVETLRDKLSRLLSTAGMSETDVKAQNLLSKLNLLVDRKGKRRELILLSLEYFKLIEQSYEHYEDVNKEIDDIIAKSKLPNITIENIEGLLKQLDTLKTREAEQERRLQEIERIARIIFDMSQEDETRQHYPLRDRSAKLVGDISRVEIDLNNLLGAIRSQNESAAASSSTITTSTTSTTIDNQQLAPSTLEQELESQIIIQRESMITTERETYESSRSVVSRAEEQQPITVVRPKSQEMCTQTSSVMDDDELDAKTREYLKEKDKMTMAVLEALRQSMSPLPPPQTVEKETQFEELEEEVRSAEKVDRDTLTQTIKERLRSFETQTEFVRVKGVEMSTETEEEVVGFSMDTTALLQVVPPPPPPAAKEYDDPIFIQPLKDLIVNEGDKVVLECKTTGRIKKLVWLKDGLEIVNNPDYKTDFLDGSTARLCIDEALHEDSAIFTCRAYGEGDSGVMVETSGRLTIREPVTSVLVPPRFLPHSPVSVGEHGKPHYVQLKVEGNPLPTVQWFKDGQCIDTSPDYIITFNNGLCEIQFDELVKDMDDGVYTCVGSNKLGDCETKVELQIKGDIDVSKKLSRQPPRVVKPLPKNLMSRAGQKVRLECEFESHTDFTVVWIKDDNKILTKTNSSAEITTQDSTSTLVFNEAYPVNSGKYTVLIRNAGGECQSDCQMVVKGLLPAETSDSELNVSDGEAMKPSVKMPLKDSHARVGDSLRLDCVIVGNPEPEVIWYKNAIPLKESPNHHLLFHGDKCSLVIDYADLQDNGIYSVSAINNCGEAASKCQVFVYETSSPEVEESKPIQSPIFTRIIQDEMVTAGHEFSFIVELAETPDNPDVVTEVTWWKNNAPISPTSRVKTSQDGLQYKLHFEEVVMADKGNYMVKAVNPGGDAKCFGCLIVKENFEKSVPEQVTVKETTEKPAVTAHKVKSPPTQRKMSLPKVITKAPRFVVPLEGRMVDEGDKNVSLKCVIDAFPTATIKWTKNNGVDRLNPGPDSNFKLYFNEKSGEAELIFSTVNVKDGGRYTCHASNEHGLASSVTDLVVKKTTFPPVFSKRLQSLTVEEGKRIYLEVDVYGKPPPQILWYLNGQLISSSVTDGIAFKSDTPTRHSLIISESKADRYSGEYKVIAKNEAGEASSGCTVNVIGKQEVVMEIPVEVLLPPTKLKQVSSVTESLIIPETSGRIVAETVRASPAVTNLDIPVQVLLPPTKLKQVSSVTESFIIPETSGRIVAETVRASPAVANLSITKEVKQSEQKGVQEGGASNIIESTTTTIITSTEEHLYESRVTKVISPVPPLEDIPLVVRPTPPPPLVTQQPAPKPEPREQPPPAENVVLVPGPEPEILVAPLPLAWSKSKNQVQQKVKKFEEEGSDGREEPPGPSGGVRIIPISKSTTSPSPSSSQVQSTSVLDFGEVSRAAPILPPMMSPPPLEHYLIEPPKVSHDALSSFSMDSYTIGDTFVTKEESHQESRSARELRYIRPSKFVPEKMRESDYESEVESAVIPPKWIPPLVSAPPPSAPPAVTSAFVPLSTSSFPSLIIPQTTLASSMAPTHQQPVPSSQPPPPLSRPATEPVGVKSIAKLWPPQSLETTQTIVSSSSSSHKETSSSESMQTLKSPAAPSGSRLSPIITHDRARSPTPNKEALEMDKLWSKPIRFSSPITVPSSNIPPASTTPAPPPPPATVSSPSSTLKRTVVKPEVPPKPPSSWMKRTTPTPYSPVTSPLPPSPMGGMKPEVPPKPSYLKSASPYSPLPSPLPSSRPVSATPGGDPGLREPLYYISSVSTPRTTPVPPQLGWTSPISSTPEIPMEQHHTSSSSYSQFHEKREFFESTTTSYSTFEETSSSQKQQQQQFSSSSSKQFQSSSSADIHPSGISLLDQSLLPPPGEPPVFMYAPPPPKPSSSSLKSPTQVKSTSFPTQPTTTPPQQPSSVQTSSSKVEVIKQQATSTLTSALSSMKSTRKPETRPQQQQPQPPAPPVPAIKDQRSQSLVTSTELAKLSSACTAVTPFRRQDAPYIRPTKFVPVLDYFSSSDATASDQESGGIKPKWKPGEGACSTEEEGQQLSTWRKVTYEVPPSRKTRRDPLTAFVDKSMQDMNKQFKANISQFSQGLCYNHMERKIQSDLGTVTNRERRVEDVQPSTSVQQLPAEEEQVEGANPLIYFKYDFGYEFGIASPRTVRASSEPPSKALQSSRRTTTTDRPTSMFTDADDDDDTPIVLPIIHEKTNNNNTNPGT